MVIFHLNYSLVNIFNNNILNIYDDLWFYIWRISALLFIFISWISFFLAEKKYGSNITKKYTQIILLLWVIAWFISLSTFLFFPDQYIRFGIIHFFALSFFLMLFFRKLHYYNIIIAICIIVFGFYFIPIIDNQYFYFLWFVYRWFRSADFYPILPYFAFMLLWYSYGLFLSNTDRLNILKLKTDNNILYTFFWYLWKRSLILYLIHQPIIIFILFIIYL